MPGFAWGPFTSCNFRMFYTLHSWSLEGQFREGSIWTILTYPDFMAGKAIVCVVKVRWGHGCEGRYQDDLASYKNIQVWRDEVFYCLEFSIASCCFCVNS